MIKKPINLLSIALVIVFVSGLFLIFKQILLIVSNRYIQYKMYRIAILGFYDSSKQWIVITFIVLVAMLIVGILLFFARELFFKKIFEVHIEKKFKLLTWIFTTRLKFIKKTVFIMIIVLGILDLGVAIDSWLHNPKGPNVIIIGIDTLRADHLSCYGYNKVTTPNIDMFAKQGIIFKQAFSASSHTMQSFHSILTSLYSSSHGVTFPNKKLDASFITLAELLKNQNYKTAGFISGPPLRRVFGFGQGFELYDESVSSKHHRPHRYISSDKLNALVLPWLQKNRNKKFFLFLHYWDPHYDYIPPLPYDKVFDPDYSGSIDASGLMRNIKINPDMDRRNLIHVISLYDGEICWTDRHLGKLFGTLESLGLNKNTVVVIVGDHGEEFFEHKWKGHSRTLYNEVIHVPLIFKIPGLKNKKDIIETEVSTIDIFPTILDILYIKSPVSIDGESLMSIIYGKSSARLSKTVYSELFRKLCTVIDGHWKFIYNKETQKSELYDILNDYSENNNLINANAQQADILKKRLFNWLAEKANKPNASSADIDKETSMAMKSLGYLN